MNSAVRTTLAGIAFAALLQICTPLMLQADITYEVTWDKIAQGFEVGRIQSTSSSFFGTALLAFRVDLQRFRVAALPAEDFGDKRLDARAICKASRASLCINANFFDEAGNALGLVVTRGIQRNQIHRGGRVLSGIFKVTRESARIIHRAEFEPASIMEAVQAGPRLLVNGNKVPISDPSSSRRAGICIDKKQRLVFYITSANSLRGISIPDLQRILTHPDIDCDDALNLDGGSSAQLYIDPALPGATAQSPEISIEGGVRVPVFLGLFPR